MLDETVASLGSGSRGIKVKRDEYFPKSPSSVLPQVVMESRHLFLYNETSVSNSFAMSRSAVPCCEIHASFCSGVQVYTILA